MKVRIYFTLVGKSNIWKRHLSKLTALDFANTDTLEYVRETVANQFGDRALVIVNEDKLKDGSGSYPEYFAAGWFVSEEDNPQELIVVDHGNSMESAVKAMMSSVKTIGWQTYSVRI